MQRLFDSEERGRKEGNRTEDSELINKQRERERERESSLGQAKNELLRVE